MKKLSLILTASVFLFSACNLSLPQDVTVKTDAKYEFALGDVGHDFNDSFDKAKLFEKLEDSTSIKVYDYFPGQKDEDLQQFILTVPLGDIDLPYLIKSFAASQLGSSLANLTIPEDFTISTSDLPNLTGYVDVDLDLDKLFSALDVLGDDFKEKVNFTTCPIYFYCDLTSGFKEFHLHGSVSIDNLSATTDPFEMGSDTEEITPVPAPVLKDASGSTDIADYVVTDISAVSPSLYGDFAKFANDNKASNGTLRVSYDLSFDGVTDGTDIGKISLNAYLVMPLEFTVNTSEGTSTEPGPDLQIDVIALAKQDQDEAARQNSDIFNRDKATDLSDIQKYIDIIDEATINYTIKDLPVSVDRIMYLVLNSDRPYFDESFAIDDSGVTDKLDITGDEVIEMLETYPYTPDVYLSIPDDSVISLPRDIQLEMNMDISLKVNGELKF